MFLGIYPFLLDCPFYWHIFVLSNLLWSFVFLWCRLWFYFFHFWFYLFGPSLSWWVWLKVYQFCLSFQRTHNFIGVYFLKIFNFLVSISFTSALIFMISFLLLISGLFVLLFLVPLGVRLGCLFESFLVSRGRLVSLQASFVELLSMCPRDVDCCIYIFICFQVFFDFLSDFLSKPLVV